MMKKLISLLFLSFFISTVCTASVFQVEEVQEYEGKYTTLKGGCLITRSRDDLVLALKMMKGD